MRLGSEARGSAPSPRLPSCSVPRCLSLLLNQQEAGMVLPGPGVTVLHSCAPPTRSPTSHNFHKGFSLLQAAPWVHLGHLSWTEWSRCGHRSSQKATS